MSDTRSPPAPRVRSGDPAIVRSRSRRPAAEQEAAAAGRRGHGSRARRLPISAGGPALGCAARLGTGRRGGAGDRGLVRAPRLGGAGARGLDRLDHARCCCWLRPSPRSCSLLRELIGFSRLARLNRIRADVATAVAERDPKRERKAALRLAGLYARRPEQSWSVRRFREHARDVHDAGELLALADREMVAPLDTRGAAPASPGRPSASPPSPP